MRECFVFVQLPGQTACTVAGRFRIDETQAGPVGSFTYGKSYLSNNDALPLDVVALPLREQEFSTTLTEGFFGVLRDALPDDWGRHVAQRLHGDAFNSPFDFLNLPSGDRFGALSFGPAPDAPTPDQAVGKLNELPAQVLESLDKIDRDVPISEPERRAALAFGGGTHAGGARPKLTLEHDGCLWIAKLNRHDDDINVVRVEAATLDLAHECGIAVPEHRVESIARKELLMIRRFDREIISGQIMKHRTASAAAVFRADEAYARTNYTGSYMRLARELARWGIEVAPDRRQMFRRVTFNCLASVTDDHERNHALVAVGSHFRLAPAFDLIPCRQSTREKRQAMNIGAHGGLSTRENLMSSVSQFELDNAEARQIIDEVQQIVQDRWRPVFVARGVAKKDVNRLAPCFDHDYFEHGPRPRPGLAMAPEERSS